MGYQEFVVKIPKKEKEAELFEKIREIVQPDSGDVLNLVATIKRNAPEYGLTAGDRFFVVTGDRHAIDSSLHGAGCNFYPIDDVIRSCYKDVFAYGAVFQDTPYCKEQQLSADEIER